MESFKEAVLKAKASPSAAPRQDSFGRPLNAGTAGPSTNVKSYLTPPVGAGPGLGKSPSQKPQMWMPPSATPDPAHLERNRVVSLSMTDPSHVVFNLLRTKVYKTLSDNKWRTLAITSPTAGCGKTMVAVNLAFSLARQSNCRTVLIDLDLRKAEMARTVGLTAESSIGLYLQGKANFEDCFVQVSQNLTLGLNSETVRNSAELMHAPQLKELLRRVTETLAPDVVIFDLPPVLAADDSLAFAPNVESYLLVAAAGATTAHQIRECERQLVGHRGYLGVVLNKSSERPTQYYYGTP